MKSNLSDLIAYIGLLAVMLIAGVGVGLLIVTLTGGTL